VLESPVGRVRAVGMVEAVSFILLVFIAVPMKRVFHMPEGEAAVLWIGSIHGALFLAYAAVAFWAWKKGHLSVKLFWTAALASVLPFGPFVIDRRLKAVEKPQPDTAEVRG
jgi:integral membrane protein